MASTTRPNAAPESGGEWAGGLPWGLPETRQGTGSEGHLPPVSPASAVVWGSQEGLPASSEDRLRSSLFRRGSGCLAPGLPTVTHLGNSGDACNPGRRLFLTCLCVQTSARIRSSCPSLPEGACTQDGGAQGMQPAPCPPGACTPAARVCVPSALSGWEGRGKPLPTRLGPKPASAAETLL